MSVGRDINRQVFFDRAIGCLACDTSRANFAATLNQRDNGLLVLPTTLDGCVFLAANVGLVSFNNTATGTHRGRVGVFHCMTDAMGHKPSSFVGNAQRTVDLMA